MRCLEVAAGRAVRRLRFPGDWEDQRRSMLGCAAILLHTFLAREPWSPGRFVAWASSRLRDELAKDHGLRRRRGRGETNWGRRELGLEALEGLSWEQYRESA